MLSIFNQSAGQAPFVIAPCDPKCAPASVTLSPSFGRFLSRIANQGEASLISIFGTVGASLLRCREVECGDFIRNEFASKWHASSPDNINDASVYMDASAATVSTAGVWALLDTEHQRLFRDLNEGGNIYRPLGAVFHITIPEAIYRYQFGITDDNSSPADVDVDDYANFTFVENGCREVYIFVPRCYGPADTNTIHSDGGTTYESEYLNLASENDPDTAAVANWAVQKAYDVSGAQVATTIQTESWLVFGTPTVLNDFVKGQTKPVKFENLSIGAA
jgi:hypothetical protein